MEIEESRSWRDDWREATEDDRELAIFFGHVYKQTDNEEGKEEMFTEMTKRQGRDQTRWTSAFSSPHRLSSHLLNPLPSIHRLSSCLSLERSSRHLMVSIWFPCGMCGNRLTDSLLQPSRCSLSSRPVCNCSVFVLFLRLGLLALEPTPCAM